MLTDANSPSIRDLLLVIVSQLGLCVIFLAEVVNATSGYDTTISLIGQLLGAVTIAGALLALFVRYRVGAM